MPVVIFGEPPSAASPSNVTTTTLMPPQLTIQRSNTEWILFEVCLRHPPHATRESTLQTVLWSSPPSTCCGGTRLPSGADRVVSLPGAIRGTWLVPQDARSSSSSSAVVVLRVCRPCELRPPLPSATKGTAAASLVVVGGGGSPPKHNPTEEEDDEESPLVDGASWTELEGTLRVDTVALPPGPPPPSPSLMNHHHHKNTTTSPIAIGTFEINAFFSTTFRAVLHLPILDKENVEAQAEVLAEEVRRVGQQLSVAAAATTPTHGGGSDDDGVSTTWLYFAHLFDCVSSWMEALHRTSTVAATPSGAVNSSSVILMSPHHWSNVVLPHLHRLLLFVPLHLPLSSHLGRRTAMGREPGTTWLLQAAVDNDDSDDDEEEDNNKRHWSAFSRAVGSASMEEWELYYASQKLLAFLPQEIRSNPRTTTTTNSNGGTTTAIAFGDRASAMLPTPPTLFLLPSSAVESSVGSGTVSTVGTVVAKLSEAIASAQEAVKDAQEGSLAKAVAGAVNAIPYAGAIFAVAGAIAAVFVKHLELRELAETLAPELTRHMQLLSAALQQRQWGRGSSSTSTDAQQQQQQDDVLRSFLDAYENELYGTYHLLLRYHRASVLGRLKSFDPSQFTERLQSMRERLSMLVDAKALLATDVAPLIQSVERTLQSQLQMVEHEAKQLREQVEALGKTFAAAVHQQQQQQSQLHAQTSRGETPDHHTTPHTNTTTTTDDTVIRVTRGARVQGPLIRTTSTPLYYGTRTLSSSSSSSSASFGNPQQQQQRVILKAGVTDEVVALMQSLQHHPNICACYGLYTEPPAAAAAARQNHNNSNGPLNEGDDDDDDGDDRYCEPGTKFAIYEELDVTLEEVLTTWTAGRLDSTLRLTLSKDIVKGLSCLHHGQWPQVLHNDLKPLNVMLALPRSTSSSFSSRPTSAASFSATSNLSSHRIVAKLIDFDSVALRHSHVLESLGGTATALHATVAYMAPELLNASGQRSAATDVYSLGVLLFQLWRRDLQKEPMQQEVAGVGGADDDKNAAAAQQQQQQPFAGRTAADIVFQVVHRQHRPNGARYHDLASLTSAPFWIPPAIAAMIVMCWHQEPTKRPEASVILEVLHLPDVLLMTQQQPQQQLHPVLHSWWATIASVNGGGAGGGALSIAADKWRRALLEKQQQVQQQQQQQQQQQSGFTTTSSAVRVPPVHPLSTFALVHPAAPSSPTTAATTASMAPIASVHSPTQFGDVGARSLLIGRSPSSIPPSAGDTMIYESLPPSSQHHTLIFDAGSWPGSVLPTPRPAVVSAYPAVTASLSEPTPQQQPQSQQQQQQQQLGMMHVSAPSFVGDEGGLTANRLPQRTAVTSPVPAEHRMVKQTSPEAKKPNQPRGGQSPSPVRSPASTSSKSPPSPQQQQQQTHSTTSPSRGRGRSGVKQQQQQQHKNNNNNSNSPRKQQQQQQGSSSPPRGSPARQKTSTTTTITSTTSPSAIILSPLSGDSSSNTLSLTPPRSRGGRGHRRRSLDEEGESPTSSSVSPTRRQSTSSSLQRGEDETKKKKQKNKAQSPSSLRYLQPTNSSSAHKTPNNNNCDLETKPKPNNHHRSPSPARREQPKQQQQQPSRSMSPPLRTFSNVPSQSPYVNEVRRRVSLGEEFVTHTILK